MQFCYNMHSHLHTVFFILSKSWARAFRKVQKSRQILNSKAFFLIFYSLNKLTKIDASKKRAVNLINFPVFYQVQMVFQFAEIDFQGSTIIAFSLLMHFFIASSCDFDLLKD